MLYHSTTGEVYVSQVYFSGIGDGIDGRHIYEHLYCFNLYMVKVVKPECILLSVYIYGSVTRVRGYGEIERGFGVEGVLLAGLGSNHPYLLCRP